MAYELVDSFLKSLEKKLTTPIYGFLAIFWAIFHWKFFVVLFFVSESSVRQTTGLLKSDYLSEVLFKYNSFSSYILWLLPFLFTWLAIWCLPKWILLPAFKKEESYKTQKKIIVIEEQRKVENAKTALEKTSLERLKITEEKVKKEEEITKLDQSNIWEVEYHDFRFSKFYEYFDNIIEIIYRHGGRTYNMDILSGTMGGDILAYFDSNG
ncbi:MAG TPA: hypothetical protein PKN62_01170, partial [bacterium]|nr:hypothetical protein [bacterium]